MKDPKDQAMQEIRRKIDKFLRELGKLAIQAASDEGSTWSSGTSRVGWGLKERLITEIGLEIDELIRELDEQQQRESL